MVKYRRIIIASIVGGILGLFVTLGVGTRIGIEGNEIYLLSLWYNCLLMGVVIGIAPGLIIVKRKSNVYIRGALIGLFVALAFALPTGFQDISSLLAQITYGIIIDFMATRFG